MEIRKLILTSQKPRCYILMNFGKFNNSPQENTVPPWLLPCTCGQQRCHCNARFKHDLLCIKGLPYLSSPPLNPTANLTVQFIECTFTDDRFPQESIYNKITKYQPLINTSVKMGGKQTRSQSSWWSRGTMHAPSMKQLENIFQLYKTNIKHTFKAINTSAIQYVGLILLHKWRIDNNQSIPTD